MWECVCDCGEIRRLRTEHLKSGRVVSCGCSRKLYGSKRKDWRGCGELPGHYMCHLRNRAVQFGHEFDLTPEFLWDLFLKQNKRCAYSGMELEFKPQKRGRSTASLDRIFSQYGYTKDNVQWVHKDINIMKNVFRPEVFVMLCCMVSDYKIKNDLLPLSS